MAICLNFEELIQIGEPQLDHLKQVGNAYPDAFAPGACVAFAKQVRLLEGFITQAYVVAVSIAKKADDLHEVANVWERMGMFCTSSLHTLALLKNKYPDCGTSQLYDLTLDYKLACDKRYRSVIEEIECQKQDLPTGLFPAPI
jgi:hypothetical protein